MSSGRNSKRIEPNRERALYFSSATKRSRSKSRAPALSQSRSKIFLAKLEGGFKSFGLFDPDQAFSAKFLGLVIELVQLASREAAGVLNNQPFELAARNQALYG